MKQVFLYVFLFPQLFVACNDDNDGELYSDRYDSIKDVGQYWLPEMTEKPSLYWNLTEAVGAGNLNDLGETERLRGLQYNLLAHSIAGLTNKAVDEGRSQIGIWMRDHHNRDTYEKAREGLVEMGIEEQGMQNAIELATKEYEPSNGIAIQVKNLFDGYVLTDVANNPESNHVATVASHVYNAIIVDVRDQEFYEAAGYEMKYDATQKTTADAWNEFKDECSNKALVVMPVKTGELREFVIKNELFILNLNKEYADPYAGQNIDLFDEILEWLEPNAPVYGWEQGVGEDVFVERVSDNGNIMGPYDWAYNTTLTSLLYSERQPGLVKEIVNPQFIDFDEEGKRYVSFYLSDGDNVQWMMNNYVGSEYYQHPKSSVVGMSYGIPMDNLSMISPDVTQYILDNQMYNTSLVQTFSGGYTYIDDFGRLNNRSERLQKAANDVSAHMRQHRVKVMATVAKNVKSSDAKEGYQTYIDANDQLIGIIALQFSPYAGGKGDIMWFENSMGYDIPVVTIKYSLWNFGTRNHSREGTPTYIAGKLNSESVEDPFNVVSVHAWSRFRDIGYSADPTAENGPNADIVGAGAAQLCVDKINDDYKVVNVEELIWRVRMHYRPDQTQQFINRFF